MLPVEKVQIKLSDKATFWLAEQGYDPTYGARPIKRLIDEKIKKPLADELLFGKLEKGGVVKVDVKNSQLQFTFQEK